MHRLTMNKHHFYVDFNEMLEDNLILFSKDDVKKDKTGNDVKIYNNMHVYMFMDDFNDNGERDDLIAEGKIELNTNQGWSSHVKWCCRINENGVRHSSDFLEF